MKASFMKIRKQEKGFLEMGGKLKLGVPRSTVGGKTTVLPEKRTKIKA